MCRWTDVSSLWTAPWRSAEENVQAKRCIEFLNGPLTFSRGKCASEEMYRVCERPLDVQQREMCRWTDVSSLWTASWRSAEGNVQAKRFIEFVNGLLTFSRGKCAGEQMYRVCERPLDVQPREMCKRRDVSSLWTVPWRSAEENVQVDRW